MHIKSSIIVFSLTLLLLTLAFLDRKHNIETFSLDKERIIGLLLHNSHIPDAGNNSWYVYATRVYYRKPRRRIQYDMYWRNIFMIPSNTRYRGEFYRTGQGSEENRIDITSNILDMSLDIDNIKTMPAELRFNHEALHRTPYRFVSFE